MTVVMRLVLRFSAHANEHQNYDISNKIRQRMDRIRNHRGGMSNDTGHEFEHQKRQISDAPDNGYQSQFFRPFHTCKITEIICTFESA